MCVCIQGGGLLPLPASAPPHLPWEVRSQLGTFALLGQKQAASAAQRQAPRCCWMPRALGRCSLVTMGWPEGCFSPPTASGQRVVDFLRVDHCYIRGLCHGLLNKALQLCLL